MRDSSTRRRWPPDRVESGWPRTRSSSDRALAMVAASDSAAYPPCGGELPLEPRVAAHRLVAGLVVGAGHGALGLAHLGDDPVEAAGGQDAVAGQHVQVTGARVLGQVADLAGAGDRCRPRAGPGRPAPW